MKILITGGSGYLGSKLIPVLNGDITCLDFNKVEGTSFLQGDIRDPSLDLSGFDLIFHLAAVSAPKLVEKDRGLAWDVNVNGTMNLCKKLKKGQRLVFMSSAHVYDKKSKQVHKESDPPSPFNFYGLTKLVGEEMVRYHAKENGFDPVIFRLFNSYSIDQRSGLIVGDVIKKYRENELIEIYNPRARLDLVHVDDVMNVLSKSMSLPNGTYNLCSGYPVTVEEVYDEISKTLKAEKPTKTVSDEEDWILGDNSKLKGLGFDFRKFTLQ